MPAAGSAGASLEHRSAREPRRATFRSAPAASARVLTASAVAALTFLALSLVAFTRPTVKTVAVKQAFTQQVSFGYRALARAGPVIPPGS